MTYTIPREYLNGLNVDDASCLGMPHQGAYYLNDTGDAHKIEDGMHCVHCRIEMATNAHHEPAKGMGGGKAITLHGKLLRPSLHALCGFGNNGGCHGLRHSGDLKIRWVWDSESNKRAWWEGELFAIGVEPHDPVLFDFGRWEYESRKKIRGTFF